MALGYSIIDSSIIILYSIFKYFAILNPKLKPCIKVGLLKKTVEINAPFFSKLILNCIFYTKVNPEHATISSTGDFKSMISGWQIPVQYNIELQSTFGAISV